jgi:hypothetical protein
LPSEIPNSWKSIPPVCYQLATFFESAVSYQPSAISHQLSAITHQPSAIGYRPSSYRLSAIGHQAIGYQPSADH